MRLTETLENSIELKNGVKIPILGLGKNDDFQQGLKLYVDLIMKHFKLRSNLILPLLSSA